MVSELVNLALDDCLDDGYHMMEVRTMKAKKTFYTRKSGVDFDPVIHVRYPPSRADELSFTPTAKLIDQMFKTGQMVMASKNQFDFPNGVDDGRDVPFDRLRGLDYPEVSQAMLSNDAKIKEHKQKMKAMAEKAKAETDKGKEASERSAGGSAADDEAK